MASSTFPRFQELAVELQLQVWKEAACPEGQVFLDPSFIMGPQLNGFVATFFRISSARLLPFRTIDRNRQKYATTAQARTTLMATCRLSRLAVLESWWGDIVEISFRRTLLDPYQLPWLKEERDVMIKSYGILLHKLLALVCKASGVCIPFANKTSATEAGKVYAIDDRSHLLAHDGRIMCALLPGRTAKPNNIW